MREQIEIRSSDHDLVTIHVSDEQMAELEVIARDSSSPFVSIHERGFRFQEKIFSNCVVTISEWERKRYRWKDGKVKEYAPADMSDEEARKQGYKLGAELQLVFEAPEEFRGVSAELSLPVSSYLEFSSYGQKLRNNNSTPAHVLTRLGTTIRQFKIGGPVPVVTFLAVGLLNGSGGDISSTDGVKPDNDDKSFFESADPDEAWDE